MRALRCPEIAHHLTVVKVQLIGFGVVGQFAGNI
jgi:hypothetical protein